MSGRVQGSQPGFERVAEPDRSGRTRQDIAQGNRGIEPRGLEQCRQFESDLFRFVENSKPGLLQAIREKKNLDDDLKNQIKGALQEFKERFVREHKPAAATA